MNGGDEMMTTRTLGQQHLEPEELMLLVLELLPSAEAAAVEAHLNGAGEGDGCTFCQAELAAMRADLGAFALEATPTEEPPARSRERLLAAVAAEREQKEPAPAHVQAPRLGLVDGGQADAAPGNAVRSSARMPAWLGWAVAAAVALVAVHFYQAGETLRGALSAQQGQIARLSAEQARARQIVDALTDRSAQRVTLTLTKAPAPVQPTGRATYLAGKGTLIFLASHLTPLAAGKTYELWLIPANGTAPVPAGTFHPDERGSASVVTSSLKPGVEAKAFGVTIEAEGGSATPTLPIVLAGS